MSPAFSVETARAIVKHNRPVQGIDFLFFTSETWLPKALVSAGFFDSGSRVKKNRPDLWRDLLDGETVELGWADIRFKKKKKKGY